MLISFFSQLLPEFAIPGKIGSMTSHSIPLFSAACKHFKGDIIMDTIKHHFMSERKSHDHGRLPFWPKFTFHCWPAA